MRSIHVNNMTEHSNPIFERIQRIQISGTRGNWPSMWHPTADRIQRQISDLMVEAQEEGAAPKVRNL